MNRSHGHNLGKSALFLASILLASCEKTPDGSKPFDPLRDSGFVAECYAAYLDSMMEPDDVELAARVKRAQSMKEKMYPFVSASADAFGPDFVELVAKKSIQHGGLALGADETSGEKFSALLKSNLDRLDKCSIVIDRWNAQK